MTVKITTPNGGADSLDFGCARTAIVATVTGTEVSSGEGKLELKTTTGGTSAAKMTIAANGTVTLAAPLPIASGGTGSDDGAIYLQTAVASTSGTTVDFTSIPAGVKRITIHFENVSSNATSIYQVKLGDAGGIETSGYLGTVITINSDASPAFAARTDSFEVASATAANVVNGVVTLSLGNSSTNYWFSSGTISGPANGWVHSGSKALSATLDRVQVTTAGGDTFDSGKISISWEF